MGGSSLSAYNNDKLNKKVFIYVTHGRAHIYRVSPLFECTSPSTEDFACLVLAGRAVRSPISQRIDVIASGAAERC